MSYLLLGSHFLLLADSFRVGNKRFASIAKHDPISCDLSKWEDSPLKWGADFGKMPLGVVQIDGNETIPAFMGQRANAIQERFTDKVEEQGDKMLMRLKEVCCGGEAVNTAFGHHAAEGHWYYSHTLQGFEDEIRKSLSEMKKVVFRCSVCGTPLFVLHPNGPHKRDVDNFFEESLHHGWPSFRDTDIYFDEETGEMNLQTYDIPNAGMGGRPYPEEKLENAMKVLVSRGGKDTLDFINKWKNLEETKGPHKVWKQPDFEVHCKHCGAHVGHANPNAPPDQGGNRYCIDAGCIAK